MPTANTFKTASLFAVLLIAGWATAQAQNTATWIGPSSGDEWNTAADWDLLVVPGAATNAFIGRGTNVNYNAPMSAASFGVLTNSGVLNVNASGFNCSSIIMTVPQGGDILNITNSGAAVTVSGNFNLGTNAQATLAAGASLTVGELNVDNGTSSHASGTSTFTNSGGTLTANSTSVNNGTGTGTGRLVISGGVNSLGKTVVGRYNGTTASTLGTEGLAIYGGVVTMSNLDLGNNGQGASFLTAYIAGGIVTNFGSVFLNNATAGRYSRLQQSGGLFVVPDPGVVNPNSTTAGSVTAQYTVSGGTNIVGGFYFGASNNTAAATVNFTDGSVIYIGSQGIASNGAVVLSASLNSGAKFGATADWMGSAAMTINAGANPFTFQAADVDGTPHNITLNNPLGGAGSLNKTGGGTLTLNAANTYPGSTLVNGGTLALGAGGSLASTLVIVGPGTTFDVSGVTGGSVLNNNQTLSGFGVVTGAVSVASGAIINPGSNALSGTLSFSSSVTETGGAVNHFDLAGAPNPNNDLVVIAGDLDVSGTNQMEILGTGLMSGTNYTLIQYGGNFNGGISNFLVTTAVGALTNNATAKTISFIPQATLRGPTNTVWIGNPVNTNWDNEVTTNWLNPSSGALDFFVPGDSVQFTDAGASNSPVNIVGTVVPTAVLFNSQSNYVFASTSGGNIDGTASLTVTNTGTLTVLTTNTYTGVTLINGGTLQAPLIANSLSPSSIGAAGSDPSTLVLANGGELRYIGGVSASTDHGMTLNGTGGAIGVASGTTLTLNGAFSGSGLLTKMDSGELRLNVNNTTSGGILVSNGTLTLGAANAAGTGGITNDDGTTLKITSAVTVPNVFNVNGTVTVDLNNAGGDTALDGAWTGSGTVNVINQQQSSRTFTMGGNGNGGGNLANFSGTVACGTNSGSFRFNDGGGSPNTGGTNMTLDLGAGTATFLVRNGGLTINLGALLGGSSTFLSGRGSGSSGTVTYSIGGKNTNTIYSGTIKDGGNATALTKIGTGTLTLQGVNTYTGPTIVSNGVLALSYNPTTGNDGAIANSPTITIAAGAVIDVSGESAGPGNWEFATVTNQILQGYGTINGALDASSSSSTIAPGGGITGGLGTLTVTGVVFPGGTVWMKLNRASTPNSDRLVSSTSDIYHFSETLVVTNVGAPLQVGDTFTLFSGATPGNGTYASLILPGYYTWDTSHLIANGTITVTGVLAHPAVTKADFSGLAGGAITLSATNGIPNTSVNVLSSTNLALPLNRWTVVTNTTFDSNGNLKDPNTGNPGLTITNLVNDQPTRFYLLQTQ